MKKSLFTGLLGAAALAASLSAQPVPEFKAMPLLTKITGTTCYYCGTWGWEQFHAAMADYEGQMTFMGNYCSYYDGYSPRFSTPYSTAFESLFAIGGYPSFAFNASVCGSETWADYLAAEQAKTWDIGMNFEAKIENGDLVIVRYVQTTGVLSGNYQLNTAVLEHEVPNKQNGQTGTVLHPFVNRWMSTIVNKSNGVYGTVLPEAALSGEIWSDTITVPADEMATDWVNWDTAKLRVALILMKDGKPVNTYTRAETYQAFPSTDINTIPAQVAGYNSVTLVNGVLKISGAGQIPVSVTVAGLDGRLYSHNVNLMPQAGVVAMNLSPLNLAHGFYMVRVTNGSNSFTQKISID